MNAVIRQIREAVSCAGCLQHGTHPAKQRKDGICMIDKADDRVSRKAADTSVRMKLVANITLILFRPRHGFCLLS